jgi:hypothetical protein
MAIATAAGALLALAILAMTVGLIRGESAGDLRTLTATGATSRIRRTLTATTAGALALLGAVLGVAGAYIALAATYHDDLGYLSGVPFLYLAASVCAASLERPNVERGPWKMVTNKKPATPTAAVHRPVHHQLPTMWIGGPGSEASEHSTHLPALADPRADR